MEEAIELTGRKRFPDAPEIKSHCFISLAQLKTIDKVKNPYLLRGVDLGEMSRNR